MTETREEPLELLVGIDVGSTTTKIAAVKAANGEKVYFNYERHSAAQQQSVFRSLNELKDRYPDARIRLILTGSGAKPIAEYLQVSFIQEVVANALALQKSGEVRTAIELGGQDAKIIFFGPLVVWHRDLILRSRLHLRAVR